MRDESVFTTHSAATDDAIKRAYAMRADYIRSIGIRFGAFVSAVSRGIVAGLRTRQVMNELYTLSDRELADIGITRGDIPYLADHIGSGKPVDIRTAVSTVNARHNRSGISAASPANTDLPAAAASDSNIMDGVTVRQRAA